MHHEAKILYQSNNSATGSARTNATSSAQQQLAYIGSRLQRRELSQRGRLVCSSSRKNQLQSLQFAKPRNPKSRPETIEQMKVERGVKSKTQSQVQQTAFALQARTRGRVSSELALFMYTEQFELLETPVNKLGRRILDLSTALDIEQADVAHLLASNPKLLHGLPYELNAKVQALAAVMQLGVLETMYAVARDLQLLDMPPLRLEESIKRIASALMISYQAASVMVQLQPLLVRVQPDALASRAKNVCQMLLVEPSTATALLQQQPELLLVPSSSTKANFDQMMMLCGMEASQLREWALQAPLMIIIPADVVAERAKALQGILKQKLVHQHRISYISSDPRVLLQTTEVLQERLQALPRLLMVDRDRSLQLARRHASFLAIDPGAIQIWLRDVEHITLASAEQACKMAQAVELLTSQPQDLLAAVELVASSKGCSVIQALDECADCPQLLVESLIQSRQ